MKNIIRKHMTLALAMIMILSINACKREDKPEVTSANQFEIALSDPEVLSEKQTEEEISQNLIATEKDFEDLVALLSSLTQMRGWTFEYSNTSSDAYENVVREIIPAYGEEIPIYKYVYKENSPHVWKADRQNDPLDRFRQSNCYYYEKVSAERIDWILENIFNVRPNHDGLEITDEYGNDNSCRIYYYDGYYYYGQGDGGGSGYILEITNYDKNDDNTYVVYYNAYDDEDELYASYKVQCALKDMDYGTFWSLYSIERLKESK